MVPAPAPLRVAAVKVVVRVGRAIELRATRTARGVTETELRHPGEDDPRNRAAKKTQRHSKVISEVEG